MNKEYNVELQKLYLEMLVSNPEAFVRVQNIFNPQNGLWTETKQNTQFRENTTKWRGIMGTGVIGLFLKQNFIFWPKPNFFCDL